MLLRGLKNGAMLLTVTLSHLYSFSSVSSFSLLPHASWGHLPENYQHLSPGLRLLLRETQTNTGSIIQGSGPQPCLGSSVQKDPLLMP